MKNAGNPNIKWVISFDNNKPVFQQISQPIEELAPENMPSSGTQRVHFTDKQPESQEAAIESLKKIEQSCEKFKGEYLESLIHQYDLPDEQKALEVAHHLKDLFSLIVELAKVIKRFSSLKDTPSKEQEDWDE